MSATARARDVVRKIKEGWDADASTHVGKLSAAVHDLCNYVDAVERERETLLLSLSFTMAGRGFDSDQGRAAPPPARDPWLSYHRVFGPMSLLVQWSRDRSLLDVYSLFPANGESNGK